MRRGLVWVLVGYQCGFAGDFNVQSKILLDRAKLKREIGRQVRSAILQGQRGRDLLSVWIPTNTEVIRGEWRPDTPRVPVVARQYKEPDTSYLLYSPIIPLSCRAVTRSVSPVSDNSVEEDLVELINPLIVEVVSNWLNGE